MDKTERVLPPNWRRPTGVFGGRLTDVPEPHVYYFAGPGQDRRLKRNVKAWIIRYAGGGIHYYATVQEDGDFVWDGRSTDEKPEGCWRACHGDPKVNGRRYDRQCKTVEQAEAFIRETFAEHFPAKRYRRMGSGGRSIPKRWVYAEGD